MNTGTKQPKLLDQIRIAIHHSKVHWIFRGLYLRRGELT